MDSGRHINLVTLFIFHLITPLTFHLVTPLCGVT